MSMLSIGALAKACGVPANTLRTWERRYGFPTPQRTPGGHRLYDPQDVERLKRIAAALALGHRAGQVVALSPPDLDALIGQTLTPVRSSDWLEHVVRMDMGALDQSFRRTAAQTDLVGFVHHHAAPFLREVGEAWAAGVIDVHQEHLASLRMRVFLESLWIPLATRSGRPLVLATLPGEQHDLGLHMLATVAAAAGRRLLFLGANLPIESIVHAVRGSNALALLISVSDAGAPTARPLLGVLRAKLGDVPLVVGGSGAPSDVEGVEHLEGIEAFDRWVRSPSPGSLP